MRNFFIKFIVTTAYAGYVPKASGTFASFIACIVFYFIQSKTAHLVIFLIITFLGYYLAKQAVCVLGSKDPKSFVIDEWAGMMLGLLFIPRGPISYLICFILFRFFDVVKPLGIKLIDNDTRPGSIMSDDILAGIYTNIVFRIMLLVLPGLYSL